MVVPPRCRLIWELAGVRVSGSVFHGGDHMPVSINLPDYEIPRRDEVYPEVAESAAREVE
jgi:hypothetical protein